MGGCGKTTQSLDGMTKMVKPKYLVYRTDKWYDGCDEEESLKWAEHAFKREFDDINSASEEEYLIFAEVVKCLSFKEIQSSKETPNR